MSAICILLAIAAATAADLRLCAPISDGDVRQITRVIRDVTTKPILVIMGVDSDTYVPGSVTGQTYTVDVKTGKHTDRYTRTDLVSVYMRYTDRSHVDVYTVRKVHGKWKVESKHDWFLFATTPRPWLIFFSLGVCNLRTIYHLCAPVTLGTACGHRGCIKRIAG